MEETAVARHAYARVGLLGNPSDGYFGRAISVALRNFRATVSLEESAALCIASDVDEFRNLEHFVEDVRHRGYRGDARLVKAAIKTFADYCTKNEVRLGQRNFTARYSSTIPRQVGLAGSSAIVTAALRALMDFFEVDIPLIKQPALILSAEVDELGITAGLQDRVVQAYEGLVYMDFSEHIMTELGHGSYEILDTALLPTMFVAHRPGSAKVSGSVLNDLRSRWERGDPKTLDTIRRIADLAKDGKDTLLQGDHAAFASLMNDNFNLRSTIMLLNEHDIAMVEAARALGVSAKLTGSGGAIVGTVENDNKRALVTEELERLGALVIEPMFA